MLKGRKNPAEDTKENIKKLFDSKEITVVKESDSGNLKPINEVNKKWDMNDKIIDLFISNISKDQNLRKVYAIILIGILAFELIALITIFVLKGVGILNYSDSTFNIFITGGIAEVFILVRVIVKYLFKDNLTEALNIILRNNNQTRVYTNNLDKTKKRINKKN